MPEREATLETGAHPAPVPPPPPARPALREWQFSVLGTRLLTPHFLRVSLSAPDLALLTYDPGQALRFLLPGPAGTTLARDYTIRDLNLAAARIEVDVYLHGETPGPTWARGLRRGDRVKARGPRSRVRLWPGRRWYLLAGDETALPAILHMLERLPAGATAQAFIEIGDASDRIALALPEGAQLVWVIRPEARSSAPHEDFIAGVLDWPRPEGQGQACLIGQTATVQAMRRGLLAAGMAPEDIAAEGYWRPGRVGGTLEPLA